MAAVITPVAHADSSGLDNESLVSAAAPSALGPLRLTKSNGIPVTVTVAMQRNAQQVINTIRSATWPNISTADKDRLIVISLMTMAQESTFYTHPTARVPDRNNDVGPFQQRSLVGWYADGLTQEENVAILNNIPYATRTFIEGHRVPTRTPGAAGPLGYIIPGVFQMKAWRTDDLWKVAANVQRPAAKYRYYYEYWRPVAEALFQALEGRAPATVGPLNVYTTAGDHEVNGRKWRTRCESYSPTISRCRAEIWATQVTRVDGKFVQSNNWHFNNLTYLPSARSDWSENQLAKEGKFTSEGREWETSCGDSWTGPNACRSFIKTTVIDSYLDERGSRQYHDVEKLVFNNIVQFSD